MDLREALIATGEQQRLNVLRLVTRWDEENQDCAAQTVAFLQEVWPRQLAARSPAASVALAQIALRAGDRMPEVTAAVPPVLETSAEPIDALPFYRRAKDDQIARFSSEHLAIFHAVLPNDAQLWPWGMSQVIESLAEIDTLKADPRLSELRRRQARI